MLNNTAAFTLMGDYNPVTKKCVDEALKSFTGGVNIIVQSIQLDKIRAIFGMK